MAFSGTVGRTSFNTRKLIDAAGRRCRLSASQISAEHLSNAQDALYLLLSDLANQGAPLWCIDKVIYPLYNGVSAVTTYKGTVDILNGNLRSLQPVTGTVTTNSGLYYVVSFTAAATVATVGIKWSGASTDVQFQRSDDGVAWTLVQVNSDPLATAGQRTWYDLDSVVPSAYFRIVANSGSLNISEVYLGNTPSEIPLGRLNRDDYTAFPDKTRTGDRPLQYWLDRQALSPVLHLWPAPNANSEYYQLVLYVHRHIMDVGTLAQDIEVPQRWLEAITAMLAAKLVLEWPEVDMGLLDPLSALAAQALATAQAEERDNSPIMIAPNIAMYTA